MPTYEYACKGCGEHVEVVQSFKDSALTECPACGGQLRKVFGNIGITFKGSGFYKTDSRSDSRKAARKSGEAKAGEAGPASSGDGSGSTGTASGGPSEGPGPGGRGSGGAASGGPASGGSGPAGAGKAGGTASSGPTAPDSKPKKAAAATAGSP
ncbi:MAG: FmdB family zinc ribbon protein [Acidimicrobiales bacterium]